MKLSASPCGNGDTPKPVGTVSGTSSRIRSGLLVENDNARTTAPAMSLASPATPRCSVENSTQDRCRHERPHSLWLVQQVECVVEEPVQPLTILVGHGPRHGGSPVEGDSGHRCQVWSRPLAMPLCCHFGPSGPSRPPPPKRKPRR